MGRGKIRQTKFKYYCDPGHGWLKVSLTLLSELGIANKISRFSYINKDYAFLEEDRDAGIFLDTMKEKGAQITLIESHTNQQSKIRNYQTYYFVKKE